MKPWLVTCVEILLKPACVFAPIVVKGTHVSVAYMMRQPEGVDINYGIWESQDSGSNYSIFVCDPKHILKQ